MNRFLLTTLFLSALAFSAKGQDVQFAYKGQLLEDGAIVTIAAEKDVWDDLNCETNPVDSGDAGLILKNNTSTPLTGNGTLSITTNTLSPRRVQWCMGSNCDIVEGNTHEKGFSVPANGYIQTQFDAVNPSENGLLAATITVTTGSTTRSVRIRMLNSSQSFVRRSVIEEFTGTWCGYCPRGMVGLSRLDEDFADRAVLIAVHGGTGEPMAITSYEPLLPSSYPQAVIDRNGVKVDPYYGTGTKGEYHYGVDVDFAAALSVPTEAGLELTAQWADAQQWDVRFTATTTFGINSAAAPYRLVFILTEDGLTGTTSGWEQLNYFSLAYSPSAGRDYTDDDLQSWRDAAYKAQGVVYNHVPVNTLGIKDGINGSITAPIVVGQPQTYSGDVTTLNVKLIQDKSRLSAVALLLNTETGQVVNAAKTAIQPFGTNAIQAVVDRSQQADAVYDLQGRRISGVPARGLYVQGGRKHLVRATGR